jgi:hypothetical protein
LFSPFTSEALIIHNTSNKNLWACYHVESTEEWKEFAMAPKKYLIGICFVLVLLIGCAGVPVREAVKVDLSVPVGKIEGNQFIGIRYPFSVSAPSGWKVTMEIPNFMEELGYERPGLEESQVFIFNPSTQSNLQIDFTPAGRYARFSQESIESLTTMVTRSLKEELEKDYGNDVEVEIGPTTPFSLKGVPFAAKKYATYTLKGVKREQGWIYGFSEPYQIFILYMILEREGKNDREDIAKILDSFEVVSRK